MTNEFPYPEFQSPREVLEARYRVVIAIAGGHGVTFDTALDGMDWPFEERAEVAHYRDEEYG